MSRRSHLKQRWHDQRERIRADARLDLFYRCGVAVVGLLVLAGGIVAIPYPGPGWLIVFLGLGILASEFAWAHRVLTFARRHYDRWTEWLGRQHWTVKALAGLLTCAIVLATLWLFGALHTVARWVHLDLPWLASPLF